MSIRTRQFYHSYVVLMSSSSVTIGMAVSILLASSLSIPLLILPATLLPHPRTLHSLRKVLSLRISTCAMLLNPVLLLRGLPSVLKLRE